jgi:small subunit ribosomal protein S6
MKGDVNVGRYENIVVLSPDLAKEEEDDLMKRIQGNLEKAGATIVKLDDWAVRKLAYPIKKKDKGHYFFFLLDMDEGSVATMPGSTGPSTRAQAHVRRC